nr:10169_t:CDS:2 [Entrophospora candida]
MPIDYSKWDKLELSDDDEIECHPNVDKASLIRWKQADIHAKREERRQKIASLKQQISLNDVLLSRIDDMIVKLKKEGVQPFINTVQQFLDQMIAVLFETVQKEVKDEDPESESISDSLIVKLTAHLDDLHTGFDKTSVNKTKRPELPSSKKKSEKVVEVLNPNAQIKQFGDENKSTTTKKDVDEEEESGDIEVTELAKQFAEIKDYKMSYEFITKHPEVVSQEMTDQILAEAFQAQLKGKAKLAKQCAHQGWLLQYCQRLGKDGVRLFFERINGPNPQAREIFMNDVNETYNHIRERCKIIAAEKTQKPQPSSRQAEQIQIEVTGPNSSLNVRVPDENSTDKSEQDKYKIFTTLPKNLQEALKTGEITKINEVLGEMSVEEAEDALKICGDADVLSIEEGIIDTTKDAAIYFLVDTKGKFPNFSKLALRLGVRVVASIFVCSQIIDHFGLINVTERKFTWKRILGYLGLIFSIVLYEVVIPILDSMSIASLLVPDPARYSPRSSFIELVNLFCGPTNK